MNSIDLQDMTYENILIFLPEVEDEQEAEQEEVDGDGGGKVRMTPTDWTGYMYDRTTVWSNRSWKIPSDFVFLHSSII